MACRLQSRQCREPACRARAGTCANAEPPLQSRASPGHCGRECNLYSFDRDFGCGWRGAVFRKQRFDAAGPLADEKVVNILRGLGIAISPVPQREGVIDQPYIFMGGVIALKARGELKYGEYQFSKHASVADVVDTIIEGNVPQHAFTVPKG